MTHIYKLTGMTCSGCEASVKKILSGVKGVSNVTTSLTEQTVNIEMTEHVSLQILQNALTDKSHYLIEEVGS